MDGPPRSGPCSPWVNGEDITGLVSITNALAALAEAGTPVPTDDVAVWAAEAAQASTEVLYELSGRKYTGVCGPVTVRPVARPVNEDGRLLGWSWGFFGGWGSASYLGLSVPSVLPHYGDSVPPEIDLGVYPVREVTLVRIDGVTIPSEEYELRDHRTLVRIRPTASYNPTERFGWPTSQIGDLPDTQEGTFSVTYVFGQPVPVMGRVAARKLAEILLLPQLGDTSSYPMRITALTRQGVSARITDVQDFLAKGMSGIYEVDIFLNAVNPGRNQQQATVWSPDIGRPRRTARPSIS
jgi:hypothetical protein